MAPRSIGHVFLAGLELPRCLCKVTHVFWSASTSWRCDIEFWCCWLDSPARLVATETQIAVHSFWCTTCTTLGPTPIPLRTIPLISSSSSYSLQADFFFFFLSFLSVSRNSLTYCCSLCAIWSENADCGLLTCDPVQSGMTTYRCSWRTFCLSR